MNRGGPTPHKNPIYAHPSASKIIFNLIIEMSLALHPQTSIFRQKIEMSLTVHPTKLIYTEKTQTRMSKLV